MIVDDSLTDRDTFAGASIGYSYGLQHKRLRGQFKLDLRVSAFNNCLNIHVID